MDIFLDGGLREGFERLIITSHSRNTFRFHSAKSFHNTVIIAVAFPGHRLGNTMSFECFSIVSVLILPPFDQNV